MGIIVANSITTMTGYEDDIEKTKSKIIRDKYGRDWVTCDVYGYINKIGNTVIKGRIDDNIITDSGEQIPCFMVDDVVCLDTKNILSCSTVAIQSENGDIPVINIELSPFRIYNEQKILKSLVKRCEKLLPSYISDKMVFRLKKKKKGFPLNSSGKRDLVALENLKLEDTYIIDINGNKISNNFEEDVKRKVLA